MKADPFPFSLAKGRMQSPTWHHIHQVMRFMLAGLFVAAVAGVWGGLFYLISHRPHEIRHLSICSTAELGHGSGLCQNSLKAGAQSTTISCSAQIADSRLEPAAAALLYGGQVVAARTFHLSARLANIHLSFSLPNADGPLAGGNWSCLVSSGSLQRRTTALLDGPSGSGRLTGPEAQTLSSALNAFAVAGSSFEKELPGCVRTLLIRTARAARRCATEAFTAFHQAYGPLASDLTLLQSATANDCLRTITEIAGSSAEMSREARALTAALSQRYAGNGGSAASEYRLAARALASESNTLTVNCSPLIAS